MTNLLNQFDGSLRGFHMKNIDHDSLHEIIGEFAPIIGVVVDHKKSQEVGKIAINMEKDRSTSPLDIKPDVAKLQQKMKENAALQAAEKVVMHGEDFKVVENTQQDITIKTEPPDDDVDGDINNAVELTKLKNSVQATECLKVKFNGRKDKTTTKATLKDVTWEMKKKLITALAVKRANPDTFLIDSCNSGDYDPNKKIKLEKSDDATAAATLTILPLGQNTDKNGSCDYTEMTDSQDGIQQGRLVIKEEPDLDPDSSDDSSSKPRYRTSNDENDVNKGILFEIKFANNVKYYQCLMCPYMVDIKSNLHRHLLIHGEKNKNHECPTCGKKFVQKCDLNRHLNIHSYERKYKCSVCEKSFKRADYLSKHERIFCGVLKPHKCSLCNKGFSKESELEGHLCSATHDSRKFRCETCGEECETVSELVEHRKTHLKKERDYTCTKCGETCSGFTNYVDHFRVSMRFSFIGQTY